MYNLLYYTLQYVSYNKLV